MQIQVQTATEALNEDDGAVLTLVFLLLAAQLARDRFHEETANGRGDIGPEDSQSPKLEGERQDPLLDGHGRQHTIGDVGRGVAHSASATAGANAAAFAREGDQEVLPAIIALPAQEAMGKDPIIEVAAKGPLNITR